jgi:hypothetical protein
MTAPTDRVMDIVDAVAALLNAPPTGFPAFVLGFQAQVAFQPLFDLKELQTLQVTCVAAEENDTMLLRQSSQLDVAVDVGVQKHMASVAEGRQLMALAYQFKTLLKLPAGLVFTFPDGSHASWIGMTSRPLWHPDQMLHKNVFTRVLCFTYRTKIPR